MAEKEIKIGKSENVSITTKKIDNGYLVTKCTYGGKGGYQESTVYTKTAPRIDIGPEAAPKRGAQAKSSLSRAVRHMK